MTTLFRHDDALILGMLLSRYFNPPVEEGGFDWNFSIGFNWGFVLGSIPSTGAGGGVKGDNGKQLIGDSTKTLEQPESIAGYGATQEEPGKGYKNGRFGIGGGEYSSTITSCGGGSGWFGGGSGYIGAGGGGGSGFVLTRDAVIPEFYFPDSRFYAIDNEEEYSMGVNEGNGKCIINETFEFNYTGDVQIFQAATTNFYTIECWGAQGGGVSAGPKYEGGKGGYVKGKFLLEAGTVLYIYVGEEGKQSSGVRAWNGGGIGAGGCYGGGGATDVRWDGIGGSTDWFDTVNSRFIVAGGGGGIGKSTGSAPPLNGAASTPDGGMVYGNTGDPNAVSTGKMIYLVNDRTICTVDLTYMVSADISSSSRIKIDLIVDGEKRGSIERQPKAGGGADSFVFNFSDWLPEGSDTTWSTIEAVVSTDLPIIIPPKGLVIRLSTKAGVNDPLPKSRPMLLTLKNLFYISASTVFNIVSAPVVVIDWSNIESNIGISSNTQFTIQSEPVKPNFEVLSSELAIEGNTLIVLKTIELPPNFNSLESNYVIEAGTRIDLKGLPVPPNFNELESVTYITAETEIKLNGGV